MNAIVCVDRNWGIGREGNLLFNIPADMQSFTSNTLGKPVIMGLNTLRSLPEGKPLKNRLNIVIAPEGEVLPEGVIHVKNIKELSDYLVKNSLIEKAMVIGGGMIYNTLLSYCKYAFVTKVDFDGNADTFIRNLDDLKEGFEVLYKTPLITENIKEINGNNHISSMQYVVYKNMRVENI